METETYDLVVIGGGAAGLMAAGCAARRGLKVVLLEKMEKTARKVRITGKGRCNLTNSRPAEEFANFVRVNADFFAPSFAAMDNVSTVKFFERHGVHLVEEQGGRIFPRSGKAWEVAQALTDFCTDEGVQIECYAKASEIVTVSGRVYAVNYFNRRGFRRKIETSNVILATGGASYPSTGSTGDGYRMADRLGHAIIPVRPSLVPLVSDFPYLPLMRGLLLKNVDVRLVVDDVEVEHEFGEMSFSDRGIEGAVALRLSRTAVDAIIDGRKVEMIVDLKSALDAQTLRDRIAREREAMEPYDTFGELVRKLAPRELVTPLCKMIDAPAATPIIEVDPQRIEQLIATLKELHLNIVDYRPFEEAVVTAGGVAVDDIDPLTLQSRLVQGLYFAGEVLDLDANTGGYNLQIAFSTGFLAAQLKK